jgi:hypothetical protein
VADRSGVVRGELVTSGGALIREFAAGGFFEDGRHKEHALEAE